MSGAPPLYTREFWFACALHLSGALSLALFPLFQRAGVRAMFSGHEHNFQHARADGVDYFVTGAAGKFRGGLPDRLEQARTQSWSAACHFLLVTIDGREMKVRAIGARPGEDIERRTSDGGLVKGPITVGVNG